MTRVYGLRLRRNGSFLWWQGSFWSHNEAYVKPFGSIGDAREYAMLRWFVGGFDPAIVEV